MSNPSPLEQQFAADAAAVEAEYQQAKAGIETMFPGLWDSMMQAVHE